MNGRTAINIPGDMPSPKSPQAVAVEKRNSMRQEQKEHHHNGAKVGGNHFNNNKVNSPCLNNLILPLLSEVSKLQIYSFIIKLFYCMYSFPFSITLK